MSAQGSARLATESAVLSAKLGVLREQLLKESFPAAVREAAARGDKAALRSLSKWRRAVGHRRFPAVPTGTFSAALTGPYQECLALVAGLARSEVAGMALLGEELLAARVELKKFFKTPPAREALFLLSPDLVEAMERDLDRPAPPNPNADDRALERRLYAFAQRLCSKNETTSFFGPLAYGVVGPTPEQFALGPSLPAGVTRREAFLAFWAAAAIGRAAALDPSLRGEVAVRRVPVSSVEAERGRGRTPDGREVRLSPEHLALLALVDDRAGSRALAERLGLTIETFDLSANLLEKTGFITRDIEPLSTTAYPLQDVRDQLPAGPAGDRFREVCDLLTASLREFEKADLAGRRTTMARAEKLFIEATGQPARRAAGQTYADRTILYEDCLGDLQPLVMSPGLANQLEAAIGPLLDLGASYGALRHAAVLSLRDDVLAGLPDDVPFLRFADQLQQRVEAGALETLLAPARDWLARLTSLVETASDGHVAKLAPEALQPLIDLRGAGRFASPDVMLEQFEDGSLGYVIGEVHPYVFAWGSQNQFAPDQEALQAAFRQDLSPWGGPDRLATVIRRRRHKGLVSHTFPGRFIEVSGRGSGDRDRCVPISALRVVRTASGYELVGPHGPFTLYTGEDDHPHLRAFSIPACVMPPVRLGAHTPRIEVGPFVLQRERWQVTAEDGQKLLEAGDDFSVAVETGRLRHQKRWPRFAFVGSPAEPKPICIDFDSPFGRVHFQRLLAKATLSVIEMVPGPQSLWLNKDGGRHTSELRMAFVRKA